MNNDYKSVSVRAFSLTYKTVSFLVLRIHATQGHPTPASPHRFRQHISISDVNTYMKNASQLQVCGLDSRLKNVSLCTFYIRHFESKMMVNRTILKKPGV